MNNKLTLRMNQSLIESAKLYAAEHGRSVSQMVADYFSILATKHLSEPASNTTQAKAPITASLIGILKSLPTNPETMMDDYRGHQARKHLHNRVD